MKKFGKKNKSLMMRLSLTSLTVGLILLVTGVSYAFFMYGKTGLYTYSINGGKMRVIYDEVTGNNVTIDNAYPLTDKEALEKSMELEFTITGYNESENTIYYAIEMDHGVDILEKNRFLDRDIKLTLYENEKLAFENEIFENLDNQDIYYGHLKNGVSQENPIINNYKLRLWINDNVFISNTIEDNIALWDDLDWRFFDDKFSYDELTRINNQEVTNVSELGISIYTTDEFMKRYASFKINVRADLTYDEIGYLTYDANGGEDTPKKTSLLTNRITVQKPTNGSKCFLGWSSDPNAIVPEYYAGDSYHGDEQVLYAVYRDGLNIMNTFSSAITEQKTQITEVYFINDTIGNIEERYNASSFKEDLTYNNYGRVLGWLENDFLDENDNIQYYKLYIGSEGTTYISTGAQLFNEFTAVNKFDFSNFDCSRVKNFSKMFRNCVSLETMDLSAFNTKKLQGTEGMFFGCLSLVSLDLSNFNTSSVITMQQMFANCKKLVEVNVSSFDTSKVQSLLGMFINCDSLRHLDLSNFYTPSVKYITYLNQNGDERTSTSPFAGCLSLESLDISNFDFSNVTDLGGLFLNCNSLKYIKFCDGKYKMDNVTSVSFMFAACYELDRIDLSPFTFRNINDFSGMFVYCINLEDIEFGKDFDMSNALNTAAMFNACMKIKHIDTKKLNVSNVTDISRMFSFCYELEELDLSHFDTSKVVDMEQLFAECHSLNSLNLSNWNTSLVIDMFGMFYNCNSLEKLNLSSFDTNKVEVMEMMFSECLSLKKLDISNFTFDENVLVNCWDIFYNLPIDAEVIVKSSVEQTWILSLNSSNRPSEWSVSNIIIKS